MSILRRPPQHWFADLKAEALAWWVRRAGDERLRRVIGSRCRGVLLWLIFRTIRQRAQPDPRIDATVEFRITGGRDGAVDCYRVWLTGGRGKRPGRSGQEPALTLELEPVGFLRLAGGTATPRRLWLTRKLTARGDLILALDLLVALRLPRSRPRNPSRR